MTTRDFHAPQPHLTTARVVEYLEQSGWTRHGVLWQSRLLRFERRFDAALEPLDEAGAEPRHARDLYELREALALQAAADVAELEKVAAVRAALDAAIAGTGETTDA